MMIQGICPCRPGGPRQAPWWRLAQDLVTGLWAPHQLPASLPSSVKHGGSLKSVEPAPTFGTACLVILLVALRSRATLSSRGAVSVTRQAPASSGPQPRDLLGLWGSGPGSASGKIALPAWERRWAGLEQGWGPWLSRPSWVALGKPSEKPGMARPVWVFQPRGWHSPPHSRQFVSREVPPDAAAPRSRARASRARLCGGNRRVVLASPSVHPADNAGSAPRPNPAALALCPRLHPAARSIFAELEMFPSLRTKTLALEAWRGMARTCL